VISTAHLEDILFASGKSCDTDCAHASLSTRTEHAEHVDRGDTVGDLLAEFVLCLMEKTSGRTAGVQEVNDSLTDDRVVGAKNGGTACLQEVIVLVTVNIIELVALVLCEDKRERIVKCEVVLNAAGDDGFCFLDHLFGLLALLGVILLLVFGESCRVKRVDRLCDELIQLFVDGNSVRILGDGESGVHAYSSNYNKLIWFRNIISLSCGE